MSTLSPVQQEFDRLTDGAFSAVTSGERAAKVRAWLASEPTAEQMAAVYKELSTRDKGAAKSLKEKLDELKRAKGQEAIVAEWAQKAEQLLQGVKLNIADALAWQRDAAKAGAPLSKEPLAGLKQQLAERTRAIEDLQNRIQVHREAAVLIAQRTEVLSTKSLADAKAAVDTLPADVAHWKGVAAALVQDGQWSSIDPKFPSLLEASQTQLLAVWDAFQAAIALADAALADVQAPLPSVPVWADEIRAKRGEAAPVREDKARVDPAVLREQQTQARAVVREHLDKLKQQVEEGHSKQVPKIAHDLRDALKANHKLLDHELENEAHAVLSQAGELEGWQRWRADQLRQELVTKACALKEQKLGGRKLQETLRTLREQWKTTDQGGTPNHALWKKFDEACNEMHKAVEVWIEEVKVKSETAKQERLALIEEVKAWTEAHANTQDWKVQIRDLHQFSERWRALGHLGEKAFAEIQPLWKNAVAQAHVPLETAQQESRQRRSAMIDEAKALGAEPGLRIDAIKSVQQRWQAESVAVPLDRKTEQKLWEVFRKPIDEAFNRKSAEREKAAAALSEHDNAVLAASKAVDAAVAAGDAAAIRNALAALEAATRGEVAPAPAAPAPAPQAASADVQATDVAPPTATAETSEVSETAPETAPACTAVAKPAKPLVAMRGDDRPGMKKTEPAQDTRFGKGRPGERGAPRGPASRDARPDSRGPRPGFDRDARPPREDRFADRGPRLGDTAFRAQRDAMDKAQQQLRKLAAMAHGETLSGLMQAWQERDAQALPSAQQLGSRLAPAQRQTWAAALVKPAAQAGGDALLRLEMAAELPTPAEHINERRALQLQLLTRRNDPAPAQTWPQDVAQVLTASHSEGDARRLMACLKVLLRKPA